MPLDYAPPVVCEVFDETVSTAFAALPDFHAPNTLQDMPPLARNGTSPTYTFSPGMTPLSFSSSSAPTATQDISSPFVSSSSASPIAPDPPFTMPTAPSRPHGKRRDPSYIPRPPNAFILFRCAFIREQNVPGKVEGNHSRLSKIIGLCWKQLPPEEREKWEAKAVVAQAEHRAHYPDWRFRPGANAMAKLKVKEGESSAAARRRSVRSRTKDDEQEDDLPMAPDSKGKGKDKGKGKVKVAHTVSLDETRCAKIAGFVAEGIRGKELEFAVKQWEGDHKMPRPNAATPPPKAKARANRAPSSSHARSRSDITFVTSPTMTFKSDYDDSSETATSTHPQNSPAQMLDANKLGDSMNADADRPQDATVESASVQMADIPLTQMFKRSLSAPAQNIRLPHLQRPLSDPSDSSNDELSPASAEPSPGAWGTFKASVIPEAPIGTHNHRQRSEIVFPTTSSSVSPVYDSLPPLTWGGAENRQEPNLWWAEKQPAIDAQFGYGAAREAPISNVSTHEMGYEIPADGSDFERNYLEHFGSYDSPQDGGRETKWTDMSSQGRQGLTVVLEDPYKDDCNTSHPPVASPTNLSLPPQSSSSYYYTPVSPTAATSPFTSSSFSTLTGWAGEYKHMAPQHAWPDVQHTTQPTPAPSNPWYSPDTTSAWGTQIQLQHPVLSHERDDWDRLEYRAANDLHLPVEPQTQLSFEEELRRANSSSS